MSKKQIYESDIHEFGSRSTNSTVIIRASAGKTLSVECGSIGYVDGFFNQTITDSTDTELISYWSGTPITTGNISFDAVTGRFTVLSTGLYSISACAGFASDPNGFRRISILVNGSFTSSNLHSSVISKPVSSSTTFLSTSALLPLTSGQTISLGVYQTSGGDLDMDTVMNGRISLFQVA